ncbi:MAG: hypothetical protein ACRBG0_16300 [Lewinella sp.]|uniref:hypothetical protein n=1 Tax=Lewinella sp. TaxID=2004506 RepID=UPI003D6AEC23
MNTRNSLYNLFFLVFLTAFSCEKENALECPGQEDRAIDVITGPNLGIQTVAYLTNEYGGLRDVQDVSTYPLFLNWLGGCQEQYTVNLLKRSYFVFPGGPAYERFSLFSYFGVSYGEAVNLDIEMPNEDNATIATESFILTISEVPSVEEIVILPSMSFSSSSDPGEQTLNINLSESGTNENQPWRYVGLRLAGSSALVAVCINMMENQNRTINFSEFDQVLTEQEVSLSGEEVKFAEVKVVLDITEEKMVELGVQTLNEQKISTWMPTDSEGVLLEFYGPYSNSKSWKKQAYYEELPAEVSLQPDMIASIEIDYDFVNVQLNKSGYVHFSKPTFPIGVTDIERSLKGLVPAGKSRVRIPKVADEFVEQFPEAASLDSIWEVRGFEATLYHYPAAQSLDQYKRLSELSWLGRQQYQWYRMEVE